MFITLQNKTLLIHPKFRLLQLSISITILLLASLTHQSVVCIICCGYSNLDIHCQKPATFMLFMKLLLNKESLKCKV